MQLTCLDYSTTNRNGTCAHDSTTKFGLSYSYSSAGNNNGLISGITDSVDSGRTATYTHDSLYRLITAGTTGSTNYPAWGLKWTYDRYGNATAETQTAGSPPQYSVTVSSTTNQITGSPFSYDLSGNMTNDDQNTLVYDGENHITSASNSSTGGAYVYDGNGLRVEKCVPSCGGSNPYTVYVFSGSKVIAEYDNGAAVGSPSREYIYSGAALLAKVDSSGTKYYHQYHLSNRLVTDSSGNVYAQMGHYPFGEKWYNATNDKLQFTTYERDSETGNDYAQARYNVSRIGRFSSPDPIAGSISDPQSLNRYSYVRNMPVSLTDSLGLIPGCIPVAKRSTPDKDNESADDSRGHGPSASDEDADAGLPEPQGDCANATGFGGGGIFLDGVDITGIGGLLGSGEANNVCPGGNCSLVNNGICDNRGLCATVQTVDGMLQWTLPDGRVLNPDSVAEWGLPFVDPFASGDPSDPGDDFKKYFYEKYQKALNDCIKQVFRKDASGIPLQTIQNSPDIDSSKTGVQLATMKGVPNPSKNPLQGWNNPSVGQNGLVYIASQTWQQGWTSSPLVPLTYAHELGNILDEKLNPTRDDNYGKHYGNPASQEDKDTGQAIEDCLSKKMGKQP